MISRRLLIGGGLIAALGGAGLLHWQRGARSYDDALARMHAPLSEAHELHDLIRYATLAASGHNTQPWKFAVTGDSIEIHPDLSRRTSVVDPDDHHLFASLGCAAENLSIAAMATGKSGEISFDAISDGGQLHVSMAPGSARPGVLFDAIPRRQTTRNAYDGTQIETELVGRLQAAAEHHGVQAIYLSDAGAIENLLELILAGNTAQMSDPAFVRELKDWLRYSPAYAAQTADGLFSRSSGNPALPEWIGPKAFDLFFKADTENEKYAAQVRSSAGLFVLVAPSNDPEGWARAGRAFQRLALQATADGLKYAFLNQAVEVPEMRLELQNLLGLGDQRPNLVIRVGRGAEMPYSLRRPVAEVMI